MERELAAEIETHLELAAEEHVRRGMSREDAIREARRSFGAVEPMKDEYRDLRGVRILENLFRDLRLAVRMHLRQPATPAIAILTLAGAIGAMTAISAYYRAAVLEPLPFRAPEELAMIWSAFPYQNIEEDGTSYLLFERWRCAPGFAEMALVSRAEGATLQGREEPEAIRVGRVSANLFPLLGVRPVLGRTFTEAEEAERVRVVVLSYGFWVARFGGSASAIGRDVVFADGRATVIGVMPENFRFPSKEIQMWEPHTVMPYWPRLKGSIGSDLYKVVARLRGTQEDGARALEQATATFRQERPDLPEGLAARVVPLGRQMTGPSIPLALGLLFAAVTGILIIASTNVAGLLFAKGVGRQKEFAIRASIGGSRARMVQQLLCESLVLAVAAGGLGLMLGSGLLRWIEAALPLDLPHVGRVPLDVPVAAFSVALTLLVALGCGLPPALRLAGIRPQAAMRGPMGRWRGRGVLVGVEIAVATVLLVGTVLLLRSFQHVAERDPGFATADVLSVRVSLPASYDPGRTSAFYREAVAALGTLPGAVSAGAIHQLFFDYNPDTTITVEGQPPLRPAPQLIGDAVMGDAFGALGVPLSQGRWLSERDDAKAPRMSVINETMARQFFPGVDPVGKRFSFQDPPKDWVTVAGVVGDMRRQGLEAPVIAQMFGTHAQFPNARMELVVRVQGDAEAMRGAVRQRLREVDGAAILGPVTTVREGVTRFHLWRRFQSVLLAVFAAAALGLSMLGVFGLLQQMVGERKREIGIRMALGARPAEMRSLVVREALRLAGAGLACGLVLSWGASGAIRSLLVGVGAHDPGAIGIATAALLSAALAGGYWPALGAARVDPCTAIREE